MIDFNEIKAEKEGRTTPKSLLTNALNRSGEFKNVLIVTIDKDDEIQVGTSESDSVLKLLGMTEVARNELLVKLFEESEL